VIGCGLRRFFITAKATKLFQIVMSHFLSFSGSPVKFSRSGYLLWSIGSLLEKRSIEFSAIHAVDLPREDPSDSTLVELFIAETVLQIDSARAILLVVPLVHEAGVGLIQSLFDLLPDDALLGKPIILFLMGGTSTDVATVERNLSASLLRLGAPVIARRVQLRSTDWIAVGDDRPRLSRTAEREVTGALDFTIKSIAAQESALTGQDRPLSRVLEDANLR
jgi:FMN reductase